MTLSNRLHLTPAFLAAVWFAIPTAAEQVEYSPSLGDDHPTQVFWGDTHVHSSFSMDANTMGNQRLGPHDAYRFAKGRPVLAHNGMTAKLDVPLDFLVVSDHAEYMGLLPRLRAGDPELMSDKVAQRLYDGIRGDVASQFQVVAELILSLMTAEPIIENPEFQRSIWREITQLADAHNAPGRFTSLIGFEWSSMPGGDNLHRVVVYRDGAEKARQKIPISAFDDERPESLWDFMERYEADTGGRILAIPHNPNMSNGRMFATETSEGRPFDRAYAARRARFEPIAEVTQIKGDSETHPFLSPDDEFADFENWDAANIGVPPVPKTNDMLQWEYARQALKNGLGESARLGVNPFKFGMIGSSDAHTAFAAVAEDNFWGKLTSMEPSAHRTASNGATTAAHDGTQIFPWSFVASGYAAVWAMENTRESLFEAMERKEVYATTGSRITLRFFGGWSYDERDAFRPDSTRIGYQKGVPMGSDLPPGEVSAAPRFLVSALKDPNGANLDRIQIVKGWRTTEGQLEERVFDVALSNGRKPGFFGGVKALKSTVDVDTATYTNNIGNAELRAFWIDPDFRPEEHAFYYARVIEIPTPRWSTYDAVRLGAILDDRIPRVVQDRAYSSPIWFTP